MENIQAKVGHNIRQLRYTRGVSLEQLGKWVGVTYQQAQKYETGANNITADKLYIIAKNLKQPMENFFGDSEVEIVNYSKELMHLMHEFSLLTRKQQTLLLNLARELKE